MSEVLLALVATHTAGDFLLRPGLRWRPQRALAPVPLDALLLTALAAGTAGTLDWRLLGLLLAALLALNGIRARLLPDRLGAFLGDQGARVAVLAGLAWAFPQAVAEGLWGAWLGPAERLVYQQVLVVGAGGLVTVAGVGRVVGHLMAPLAAALDPDQGPAGGLPGGGRIIGWLERGLVLILVLSGQPGGFGFVLAAKSILRFGEIKDAGNRRLAEFILIGTFLSFALGLAGAVLTARVLAGLPLGA